MARRRAMETLDPAQSAELDALLAQVARFYESACSARPDPVGLPKTDEARCAAATIVAEDFWVVGQMRRWVAHDALASWTHACERTTWVVEHTPRGSICVDDEGRAFAVVGARRSLRELVGTVPCRVRAVWIPFANRIVAEGVRVESREGPPRSLRRACERGATAVCVSLCPHLETALRDLRPAPHEAAVARRRFRWGRMSVCGPCHESSLRVLYPRRVSV